MYALSWNISSTKKWDNRTKLLFGTNQAPLPSLISGYVNLAQVNQGLRQKNEICEKSTAELC